MSRAVVFGWVLVLSLISTALAGGRGGHSTTWDPNLFGGNWKCFGPQITGCTAGFDAQCAGGSTNDQTAAANFNAAGWTGPVNLYIAATGITCQMGNPGDNPMDGITGNVWAYGVKFNKLYSMQGNTYFADNNHDAKIQTVSAGSCTATLVTAGDASKFAVSDRVQVGDAQMATANLGVPMTLLHSEANIITNISGSVITLNPCLQNSYSSTLPAPNATDTFQGGPATIWKLQPSWSHPISWYGLTVLDGQTAVSGRSISLVDVVFSDPPGGQQTPAPSGPGNMTISYSYMPSMEIDKNIGMLSISRSNMKNVFVQSAGSTVEINSSKISVLQGTTTNTTIRNTTIGSMQVGPTNGPGGSLMMESVTVGGYTSTSTTAGCSATMVDTSVIDSGFSNGTFTVATSTLLNNNGFATFVPGGKFYFGETDGTNDSSPHTQGTVTSMTQSGSNTSIATSLGNSLPTPTCNGHACLRYVANQLTSLVARFYSGPSFAGCVAP